MADTLKSFGIAPATQLSPGSSVSTHADTKTVVVQLEQPIKSFADPTLYAPAVPGVLVALAGLWMAHHLGVLRDRRKEIGDLCAALKKLASDAATTAVEAWILEKGAATREKLIHDTKRMLQEVGIAATHINARAKEIPLTQEVVELRRAATVDPFEDPDRGADDKAVGPIHAALATLLHAIDAGFRRKYK